MRAFFSTGALLVAFAGTACGSSPDIVTRAVTVHVPAACAVKSDAAAIYIANGDFQPQGPQLGVEVNLGDQGGALGIPSNAREIAAAVVSNNASDAYWRGLV